MSESTGDRVYPLCVLRHFGAVDVHLLLKSTHVQGSLAKIPPFSAWYGNVSVLHGTCFVKGLIGFFSWVRVHFSTLDLVLAMGAIGPHQDPLYASGVKADGV